MSSDIVIFSISVTSIISVEQLMVRISSGANSINSLLNLSDNPLVSFFFVGMVTSDVEVVAELAVFIVRAEDVVVLVRGRLNSVAVVPNVLDYQLVSVLLVVVGSDIEVFVVISVIVV